MISFVSEGTETEKSAMLHGLLHEESRPFSRLAALDMVEESKNLSEESFEQHKELTHLEHISSASTPDEELRR